MMLSLNFGVSVVEKTKIGAKQQSNYQLPHFVDNHTKLLFVSILWIEIELLS